MFHSKLNWGR